MAPQNTISRILVLLVPTIIIAIVNSYVPQDLAVVRQALSVLQLGLMAVIVILTLQSVLEDF